MKDNKQDEKDPILPFVMNAHFISSNIHVLYKSKFSKLVGDVCCAHRLVASVQVLLSLATPVIIINARLFQ